MVPRQHLETDSSDEPSVTRSEAAAAHRFDRTRCDRICGVPAGLKAMASGIGGRQKTKRTKKKLVVFAWNTTHNNTVGCVVAPRYKLLYQHVNIR